MFGVFHLVSPVLLVLIVVRAPKAVYADENPINRAPVFEIKQETAIWLNSQNAEVEKPKTDPQNHRHQGYAAHCWRNNRRILWKCQMEWLSAWNWGFLRRFHGVSLWACICR